MEKHVNQICDRPVTARWNVILFTSVCLLMPFALLQLSQLSNFNISILQFLLIHMMIKHFFIKTNVCAERSLSKYIICFTIFNLKMHHSFVATALWSIVLWKSGFFGVIILHPPWAPPCVIVQMEIRSLLSIFTKFIMSIIVSITCADTFRIEITLANCSKMQVLVHCSFWQTILQTCFGITVCSNDTQEGKSCFNSFHVDKICKELLDHRDTNWVIHLLIWLWIRLYKIKCLTVCLFFSR